MTWKQGAIVITGILLAIALYLLRSSPKQVNPLQKQIDSARVDLSEEEFDLVEEINQQYQAASDDSEKLEAIRAQVNIWDSLGSPAVAAMYAYRTVKYDSSIDNLVHTADHLLKAGDAKRSNEAEQNLTFFLYETAGQLYDRVLAKSPGNEDALIGKSMVDIQGRGEVMQGVQRLLGIVKKDSLHVRANMTLGRLNMMNGQYPKAVERMERVLQKEPLNLSALSTIANAYNAMGNRQKAIQYYEQALQVAESQDLKNKIQNRLKELKN